MTSEGPAGQQGLWEWDGTEAAGARTFVGDCAVRATVKIDWSDIRPRMAALAAHLTAADVFGANGHGWTLEPPLTEREVAEAEAQIGVELPVEYRSFLLEVSRGGAGPAYGLFPLRQVDGRWQWWEGDEIANGDHEALARPFGRIRGFNPLDGLPGQPDPGQAETEWWERRDALLYDPANWQGLLYLCHLGCALREALVVSGPSRGQMWSDDTADGDGFHPLQNPDGSRMTFADWYHRWLAETEAAALRP